MLQGIVETDKAIRQQPMEPKGLSVISNGIVKSLSIVTIPTHLFYPIAYHGSRPLRSRLIMFMNGKCNFIMTNENVI